MLVHIPVWWWYWKELLSGGLISVCWRLAAILRQHSLRPHAQESNPILMSVLFSTEINLVSVICWHLTKVFPAHLAEPHYVPVIPAHCMGQLFKFSSWSQSSRIQCSSRDVLPTSYFLDLWYTRGILVTYVPVSNSRSTWCIWGKVHPDGAPPSPGCLLLTIVVLATIIWPMTRKRC